MYSTTHFGAQGGEEDEFALQADEVAGAAFPWDCAPPGAAGADAPDDEDDAAGAQGDDEEWNDAAEVDMGDFDLDAFDPATQMELDCQMLVLGRKRAGKTTYVLNMLYDLRNKHNIAAVAVMTINKDVVDTFARCVPRSMIKLLDSSEDLGVQVEEYLEPILNEGGALKEEEDRSEAAHAHAVAVNAPGVESMVVLPQRTLLLIADDVMVERSVLSGKYAKLLLTSGRHRNVAFINLVQECMTLDATARNALDWVVQFNVSGATEIKKTYTNLPINMPSMKEYKYLLEKYTTQKGALVMRVGAPGPPRTRAFSGRSRPPGASVKDGGLPRSWRMASASMWRLHYAYAQRAPPKRLPPAGQPERAAFSATARGSATDVPRASRPASKKSLAGKSSSKKGGTAQVSARALARKALASCKLP